MNLATLTLVAPNRQKPTLTGNTQSPTVRLLVLNCHEGWIHQLDRLGARLDLVVDLPGRAVQGWDTRMRPVPRGARQLRLADALDPAEGPWDAVICHNITDLIDTATIASPKLLVIHETLEGRMAQQGADFPPDQMRAVLRAYLHRLGAHAVAVTELKGNSWHIPGIPLGHSADTADYYPPTYERAAGLRVANHIVSKQVFLAWEFHIRAFHGLPVTLVGHNPQLGIEAATDWDALKRTFAEHRFYIHTADPRYEDAFNMSTCEAMAAGLALITNAHPGTPVTHGVDGFICETPEEARDAAILLLEDIDLARTMGAAARETARRLFSPESFESGIRAAIARAGDNYRTMLKSRRG